MKLKHILALSIAVSVATAIALAAKSNEKGLVVHEWGTFTSLQGGDGVLIPWQPLQTSRLPDFVYNWSKPGNGRPVFLNLGKGAMTSLQRLETPVIYFYADKQSSSDRLDLTVRFPQGKITEWYPQASEVSPSGTLISPPPPSSLAKESMIHWSDLSLMPATGKLNLLKDASGSHYFAARDTDSDYVRWTGSQAASSAEFEKFLFYRGVGNFSTPLRVTMKADDEVSVSCNAWTTLSHIFVLVVKDKAGHFVSIDKLGPGETKTVPVKAGMPMLSPELLSKQISEKMSRALVAEGLYPREAKAMVNTWNDSWFAEDGIRVLYVLPRAWTDSILPMTLKPEPRELVRVMVGRAEVLSPGIESSLALALDQAKHGDAMAATRLGDMLKRLGRFAEPALTRAMAGSKFRQDQNGQYWALLNQSPGVK